MCERMEQDEGSSVTLVFYRVGSKWYKEPMLNILAAACQMSTFTHVEIALGEEPGQGGMMKNVCRVFNDKIGVVKIAFKTIPFPCQSAFSPKIRKVSIHFLPSLDGSLHPRTGIGRAVRTQPAVRLLAARVLKSRRTTHAQLRQDAVRWQAF